METQVTCPSCGAHNPEGAEWCSQCFSSLTSTGEESEEDRRSELAGEEEQRYLHATEAISRGRPVYSRWRATETSFGPVGRILLTLLVIAIGVFMGFSYTPIPGLIWLFVAAPVLIKAIWKRVPVGYEKPEDHLPSEKPALH